MSAPAGLCEWCGGQQNWTIHAGEMYVRCIAGCQSMWPEERVTIPPPSEESERSLEGLSREGTSGGVEGVPCEGDAAKTSDLEVWDPGEPPLGFLASLWEGYRDG